MTLLPVYSVQLRMQSSVTPAYVTQIVMPIRVVSGCFGLFRHSFRFNLLQCVTERDNHGSCLHPFPFGQDHR